MKGFYCRFIFVLYFIFPTCSPRRIRLAGGIPASIGEFPYLIASLHPDIRCTASLINPSWVLGAAHCYVVAGKLVNARDVMLLAGIVNVNDTESNSRQERRAKFIHLHPRFEETKISGSDLSLINVEPFKITNEVQTVALSGEPFLLNFDISCTASGWGDTKGNRLNNRLHKLNVVAIQSHRACHGLTIKERKTMLCLRENEGKGLCDGDSGGPLVCNKKLVGVAHQVYIERYRYRGPSDMDCGSNTIVHTYMFTCPYLNWIKFYVPEVPAKPEKCFQLLKGKYLNSNRIKFVRK